MKKKRKPIYALVPAAAVNILFGFTRTATLKSVIWIWPNEKSY